jgi:hypothetical protein
MTYTLGAGFGRRWTRFLVGLAAAAVAVALAGPTTGQPPEGKSTDPGGVRIVLSGTPIDDTPSTADVDRLRAGVGGLRPNVSQEWLTYLFFDKPRTGKLTVKLFSGKAEVASSEPVTVIRDDRWVRVPWKGEAPTPGKPAAPAEVQAPASLRVVNDEGKEVPGSAVLLGVDPPRKFLKANLQYIPRSTTEPNYLVARVWHTGNFTGPPAKVEMVLDPAVIPGYLRDGKKARGNLVGPVTAANDSEANALTLIARDISNVPGENGWVTLRVDGYDHAFSFYTTFSTSETNKPNTPPNDQPMLRLRTVTPADPKLPIRIIAIAAELPDREKDRLALDVVTDVPDPKSKTTREQASPLDRFDGERQVRLLYTKGGRRGGLELETQAADWFRDLDRRDFTGRITLRLQAFEKGNPRPIRVRDGGSTSDAANLDGVTYTLYVDDTPPVIEVLAAAVDEKTKLPFRAVPGKVLKLRAVGRDDESGIREVIFFAGRPTADKIIPAEAVAVKGQRLKAGEDVWGADFNVPRDLTGPLVVSVRFINRAGLANDFTATVPLGTDATAAPGSKKGSIAGTVVAGDRPQQGLPVTLSLAADGKQVQSTTTDEYGAYLFKDVDPGSYNVSAVMTADSTRGQTPVTVGPEEDKKDVKNVTVKLMR